MQLQDDLLTVFSARVEERDGSPVLRLPERELDLGTLSIGETYRVAVLDGPETENSSTNEGESTNRGSSSDRTRGRPSEEPPVETGDRLDVEIEDVGEQGDGVARVGPGYVVFVPDAGLGDRVTIEITGTRENFGFAEVVTPEPVTG